LEEFASSGPFVGITGPANGTLVVLPTNLVIKAVVARFPGTVTNVAFYNDVNKLADIPSSPYNFAWTDVTPGGYTLRAIGSDDTGLSVTSAPVNITVQSNVAPSIAIISPANNAFFTAPADVPISVAPATATGW